MSRASTSSRSRGKSWMAGISPAMTRVEGASPRVAYSNVKQRRFLLVTTGHSRLKNGVASLAYDPAVHTDSRFPNLAVNRASHPHGLPGHLTRRRRFAHFAGHDPVKIRSRGAFFRARALIATKPRSNSAERSNPCRLRNDSFRTRPRQRMIPKSSVRFSDRDHAPNKKGKRSAERRIVLTNVRV